MSTSRRVLRKGEIRFVVRSRSEGKGRKSYFYVYDRAQASEPHQTSELGKVKQNLPSEAEAQAEADRLNQEHMP